MSRRPHQLLMVAALVASGCDDTRDRGTNEAPGAGGAGDDRDDAGEHGVARPGGGGGHAHTHDGGDAESTGGRLGNENGSGAMGGIAGGDGGTEAGGSGGSPEPPVHGCIDSLDRTSAEADRTITWNLDLPTDEERCLSIAVGQSVSWHGNFAFHPLEGFGGDVPSPIGSPAPTDETYTVSFDEPGTFGFICSQHGEMQGAIRVVP